jgi:hypothetical protein
MGKAAIEKFLYVTVFLTAVSVCTKTKTDKPKPPETAQTDFCMNDYTAKIILLLAVVNE